MSIRYIFSQCALGLYLLTYPDSLIHLDHSAELSTPSSRVAVVVKTEHIFVRSISSRRVVCEIILNMWRSVEGLARRVMRHSHCNPSPAEQNRTEPNRTAWVVRSCTDAPFIFLHSLIHFDRSGRVPSRRCCEDWSCFRGVTRRVTFFARYIINNWRFVQGLVRRFCVIRTANRGEPNRIRQPA